MHRHEMAFTVAAPPHRVWRLLHPKVPPGAVVPGPSSTPTAASPFCGRRRAWGRPGADLHLPRARWLLSGGTARSWEVVTDARLDEYARYRAVGKPLWSEAEGEHTLEPLDEGAATRLTFVETYHAFNPLLRSLFEARVHRFISGHNGDTYERVLGHLARRRRER